MLYFRTNDRGRRLIFAVLTLIAISLTSFEAIGAEEPKHFFTLEGCLAIAFENNPGLWNAQESVNGAYWDKEQAYTNFLPTFKADYVYTRLDEQPQTRTAFGEVITGPGHVITGRTVKAGSEDNFQFQASVTQPIFTGYATLSQYQIAELGLDAAQISLQQTRLDLILKVKQAYYQILIRKKAVEVTDQSVKQLEEHLKEATSFFNVGMVPKNDVLQAEVRLAQAVQNRIVAENDLKYAKANMNTLLRRCMDAPIDIKDIMCHAPYDTCLGNYLDDAKKIRPELVAAVNNVQISEKKVQLAKAGYYPTVAVTANYTREGDAPNVNGSPYQDDPDSWNLVAAASWTFWDWGRTHKGVQSSRSALCRAKNTVLEVQDMIQLEVKRYFLDLESANKNIEVTKKAREQAQENYRMSTERYREQVATYTEVTDAQTLLTEANINYYYALFQFCLAKANLERAVGYEKF